MPYLSDRTIDTNQETIHKTFEAIAVFAVAPFMFWLSTRKELPTWSRVTSGVIGLGTVLVDGWLLLQYSKIGPLPNPGA